MAYQPAHTRLSTRLTRLITWWHGPHLPARHPALTVYALATAASMAYIVSLFAPLAR